MKGLLAWPILMIVLTFLWIFACTQGCVYGWLAEPVIEEEITQIDSCVQQNEQSPIFIQVYAGVIDTMQSRVRISVGTASAFWIDNYEVQESHIDIITDLVALYIPYTSFKVIDKTTTDNGTLNIEFAIYFIQPSGNWDNLVPDIYIQWGVGVDSALVGITIGDDGEFVGTDYRLDGDNVTILVRDSNPNSIYINTLANDNDTVVVNLLQVLPQWQIFSMVGTNLDSTRCDNVVRNGVLFNCKCCTVVRWQNLPEIDSVLQEQIDYQDIVFLQ